MAYLRQGFSGAPRRRLFGFQKGRGLGAANCPSVQQLAGIVDPTDPCQSGDTPAGTVTPAQAQLPPTCMPGDTLTVQSGNYICQSGGSATLAQMGINPLLAIGAVALLIVGVAASSGGRSR